MPGSGGSPSRTSSSLPPAVNGEQGFARPLLVSGSGGRHNWGGSAVPRNLEI